MSLIAVAQHMRRPRALTRTLLVMVAVTAGIIVGLLAMHSLNTHTSTTGHHDTVVAAPLSVHLDEVAPGASYGAGTPASECVNCGDDQTMAWMACVLGLLVGVVLLTRSAIRWRVSASVDQSLAGLTQWQARSRALPAPPSLTVLCISRT